MKTHPFVQSDFGDLRLAKRANLVLGSMTSAGSSVINRIFGGNTEKIAAYRMINNDNITCDSIIKAYANTCRKEVASDATCFHLLCIQDTCEINFEAHTERMHKKGRIPGIISNKEAGCFLHPTIAVDADTLLPIGFTHIKIWNRDEDAPGCMERKYKSLESAAKESYRWCESFDKTRELVGQNAMVTMLSDRESDTYEFLTRSKDGVYFVIRANQNRCVKGNDKKLHEYVKTMPLLGTYEFKLPSSRGRKARMAQMELRFKEIELLRPHNNKSGERTVRVNCIHVSEVSGSTPKGEKPIEWTLYTNHEVKSVEQALQCVNWYKCRWFIEELFRLLKKKGFKIEDIQLEEIECIEKNILLAAYAALLSIALKHAFDNPDYCRRIPAYHCFATPVIKTAKLLQKTLDGRTKKQQNPYPPGSLSWISWIIARLGCWSGYASQARPGYTTFKVGLDKLFCKADMYCIMQDVYNG